MRRRRGRFARPGTDLEPDDGAYDFPDHGAHDEADDESERSTDDGADNRSDHRTDDGSDDRAEQRAVTDAGAHCDADPNPNTHLAG